MRDDMHAADFRALYQANHRHLIAACVVHRTGSIRKAAQLLGRTQPALSQQILALENALGFPIITHCRGSVAFTAQGQQLVRKAGVLLGDMAAFFREMASMPAEPLKIGLTEDFLHPGIRDLTPLLDGQDVDVHVQCSGELRQRLAAGSLDMALVKGTKVIPGAWQSWDHSVAWARKKSSEMNAATKNIRLVLLSDACLYHQVAVQALANDARVFSVGTVCPSWDGLYKALDRGGVTVVSRRWPGETVLCDEDDLPSLPNVTLNLLVSGPRAKQCEAIASQIAHYIDQ